MHKWTKEQVQPTCHPILIPGRVVLEIWNPSCYLYCLGCIHRQAEVWGQVERVMTLRSTGMVAARAIDHVLESDPDTDTDTDK